VIAVALETASKDASVAAYELSLFEGFQLVSQGGARIGLPTAAQRLLAYLAVHERPLLRSYVAGVLWPDKPETRSHANLRSVVWRLRQPGLDLVEADGREIQLANGVDVDARHMVALAQALFDGTDPNPGSAVNYLLSAREFLPGWYDEWVLEERERLRQLRQHALEILCSRLTAMGRIGEAVDVALSSVAEDPLRESAQRALIQAHLAEGNAAEALRQYDAYRNLLRESLGVEPGAGVREMFHGVVEMPATALTVRPRPVRLDKGRSKTGNAGNASKPAKFQHPVRPGGRLQFICQEQS
jgi:DNA-binding SARP family transcriptional activator